MLAPGFPIHFNGVQLDRAQMTDMVARRLRASFTDLLHHVQRRRAGP
jgi:hypothetical protein